MVSGVNGETPMNFWTPSGVAVPAVTTDQMREIDRIAIEDTGPNLFQMMENAARNLSEMALECLGTNWRHARVIVLSDIGIPAAAYRSAGLTYAPPFGNRYRVPLSVRGTGMFVENWFSWSLQSGDRHP